MNGYAENNSKEQKRAKGEYGAARSSALSCQEEGVCRLLLDALRVSLSQKNDEGDSDIVPQKKSLHLLW